MEVNLLMFSSRLSRTFHEGMCLLMTAADPHPLASPYPSDSMLREHEMRLNTEIYRYHDCSGRVVRDCIVVSYAEKLADLVFAKAALREL